MGVILANLDPELFCACRGERSYVPIPTPVRTGVENAFWRKNAIREEKSLHHVALVDMVSESQQTVVLQI